jgi:hypothetical protein
MNKGTTMKNTQIHAFTNDDTLVCPVLPQQIQVGLTQVATIELCESIVAEVEFRAMCNALSGAVDMTEHAVLEN